MRFPTYILPIVIGCGALVATLRADPTYTVYDASNNTTYVLEIDQTSFDASAALLETMPWWGDSNLAFQISSPFSNAYYTNNNDDIYAVFALGTDYGGTIAVNTDEPGLPYVFTVDPSSIQPYVVLATVPDISSTLLELGLAVACLVILGRRALRAQSCRL